MAKGHCKNYVMRTLIEKCWSACLKKHIAPVLEYIHTDSNPADKPSRTGIQSPHYCEDLQRIFAERTNRAVSTDELLKFLRHRYHEPGKVYVA